MKAPVTENRLSCKMYSVVMSASYGRTYFANLTACKINN